jgi:DNA/RNA endonuclease G (NUC1)
LPANPDFNRGYWAKLEKHVRDLTHSYEVEIFTGPLFIPEENEHGESWVKYREDRIVLEELIDIDRIASVTNE